MSKTFIIAIIVVVLALLFIGPYLLSGRGLKKLDESTWSKLPGETVKLSDGITYYVDSGPKTAPTVVLVHGATQSNYVWDKIVEPLNKNGFRVIRYDNFGRGYSQRPNVVYGKEIYDRQLLELLDYLKINSPVNLVGLSQGGAISVVFTARRKERVRKLVLAAPAGFPVKLSFTAKLVQLPILGDWIMAVFGKKVLLGQWGSGFKNPENVREMKDKLRKQLDYSGYLPSLLSMLRNYPLHDLKDEYKKVGAEGTPTLLIWGDSDTIVPYEHAKEAMTLMPQAGLATIKGGSHGSVYERPDEVSAAIIEFLSK